MMISGEWNFDFVMIDRTKESCGLADDLAKELEFLALSMPTNQWTSKERDKCQKK